MARKKSIEIRYRPHAFFTCQGVSVWLRVGNWQMATTIGIPDWLGKLIVKRQQKREAKQT